MIYVINRKKEGDPENISGVMHYFPMKDGRFKTENAMNLIPDHLQPNYNQNGKLNTYDCIYSQ